MAVSRSANFNPDSLFLTRDGLVSGRSRCTKLTGTIHSQVFGGYPEKLRCARVAAEGTFRYTQMKEDTLVKITLQRSKKSKAFACKKTDQDMETRIFRPLNLQTT